MPAPRPSRLRDFVTVVTFGVVTLMARSSLADHYVVPSGSMKPAVAIGDHIAVDKRAYGLRLPWSDLWVTDPVSPERGDVVVLTSPEDGRVLLKRVAALGGEVVAVRDGVLFIDGQRIAEPIHPGHRAGWGGPDFGPARVPERSLLVLGDNRGNSHDGRSFGFVEVEAVLGRAVAVYWRGGEPTWAPLR